jgi:hypothetical protein
VCVWKEDEEIRCEEQNEMRVIHVGINLCNIQRVESLRKLNRGPAENDLTMKDEYIRRIGGREGGREGVWIISKKGSEGIGWWTTFSERMTHWRTNVVAHIGA